MERASYRLWRRLSSKAAGRRLFSLVLAFRVPYFLTIRPRVTELRPGHCEVAMKNRWRVRNHIGTVHAIAMCNLAEAAMGALAEASVTSRARWIPVAMRVRYLARAETDLRAIALMEPVSRCDAPADHEVAVSVRDVDDREVFDAVITIRVSP